MPFPGIPDLEAAGITAPPAAVEESLRAALEPLADPVDAPLAEVLQYASLLLAANTVTNLTGARDWEALAEAHLVDCLLAAAYLPEEPGCLLDWGSGGGLPGLVWAAVLPDRHFHLCDRNQKKAAFLEEAASRLGFLHVDVHGGQAEEFLARLDPPADAIVARAVEPLPKFLRRLAGLKKLPRRLFLMAGRSWERDWEEMDEDRRRRWSLEQVDSYELGPQRGSRYLLHMRRSDTP